MKLGLTGQFGRVFAVPVALLVTGCTGGNPFYDVVGGSLAPSTLDPTTARCLPPEDAESLASQLVQQINLERSAAGLDPLVPDSDGILDSVAADYACQMISGGFFAHEHPATKTTPAKRISAAGYVAASVGENLAAGQGTPGEVMAQWMNSPSHRENLLSPEWREVGVAVRTGGIYEIYWVLELAEPREPAIAAADAQP